jgi:4-hydroxybenzoate polyprenyltransferase
MVYGPIAAFLVELFPTKIRYTSMSLPYHIGNGVFGGLVPIFGLALINATGNNFAGLWWPMGVASVCFVVGMLFVKETKDVDITDASTSISMMGQVAGEKAKAALSGSPVKE